MKNFDCIIVGSGPAGLSASLYCARAGLSVLMISNGAGALAKADKVDNYLGTPGVSGKDLLDAGRAQARELGVQMESTEVISIAPGDGFVVGTTMGEFHARAVILATGAARRSTTIKNAAGFEGRGVSYCAVCDAFFYKNKTVAVLGSGEYALHELAALLPVAAKCYLLTDGAKVPQAEQTLPATQCIETPVASLYGEEVLEGVVLQDGQKIAIDGLFVALGVAGAADLARSAGALVEGNAIVIDKKGQCTLPGLFAAGDCTGGVLQASVAVGEGATAALSAIAYIKKQR